MNGRPPRAHGRRRVLGALLVTAVVASLTMTSAVAATTAPVDARSPQEAPGKLQLTTLSGPADMVTGGDALLQVDVPTGVPLDRIRITVNDADVTEAFVPDHAADTLTGLVSGLKLGRNTAEAGIARGRPQAELTLVNHPIEGPLFAGPHQDPFVCDTRSFRLAVGGTLGEPLDENCSADTRVDYLYRTTDGEFVPLPADTFRPSDLEWTTTAAGVEVPYIVRVETGTINRAIYEMAVLHDPQTGEPNPWRRPEGWNERLIYKFGGGCTTGWYVQGRNTGGVMDHGMLEQGYAVASSSLNVFGNNCNDLLAAESMAMVKEHFIQVFGPPAFTLGWGSSGGAYQSHQIADNYPGLLDGILVAASFPDVAFGTLHTITDAWLLHHYFTETAPDQLSREQQREIAGFGRWESIANLAERARRIDPRVNCKSWVPVALRYDPDTNPDGARCDVYSAAANVYGIDEATGMTNRPLDNVGIQYGLAAMESGAITVDDFLDLNERIGGFDGDANVVPERTEAHLGATAAAYRSGRMLNGGGGLADIPIVDFRAYADDAANGNIHMRFHGFSTRERLRKANGTADNHVMLVANGGSLSSANRIVAPALAELDAWVTAIRADTKPADAPIDRIRRNRPEWLEDSCWTRANSRLRIRETQQPEVSGSRCADDYPVWPSPRMVAGGPLANDIVKCRRKPFDAADYEVEFSGDQRARAQEVFADGVCDWSEPGVEQQRLAGTWLRF